VITVDDIAEAVAARCGTAFQAVVTGKAWFARADEAAATPYAVFTVERAGDAEFCSDGSYLQEWTVRMGAYTEQGATPPNNVQLAMAAALQADPTGWDALRDGRVLHCLPQGFDGRFAPQLRHARDVFISGGQWKLLVEGNLEA
jgi:hypothetical protein